MSIDYGFGQTNIDHDTNIRYGCFGTNRPPLTEWFWEEVEHDYGPPTCPKCGSHNLLTGEQVTDDDAEEGYEPYPSGRDHVCGDHWCPSCKIYFSSDNAFPDEAIGWSIGSSEDLPYIVDCLDTDGLILKSAYYTYAPFCSPCVPGAGNLDDVEFPEEVMIHGKRGLERHLRIGNEPPGVKTYCLGKSWYEGEACPYPYWSVETNELVYSPPEKTPSVEEGELEALADMPIVDPGPDWLDNIPLDKTGHLEGINPNSVADPYDEGDDDLDDELYEAMFPTDTETYDDGSDTFGPLSVGDNVTISDIVVDEQGHTSLRLVCDDGSHIWVDVQDT